MRVSYPPIDVPGLAQRFKSVRAGRDKSKFPTSESLYKFVGLDRSQWWKIEHGKRSIPLERLRFIEDRLGVDLQIPDLEKMLKDHLK
jgi:transcriptional regulator with XRE-family HTH domain